VRVALQLLLLWQRNDVVEPRLIDLSPGGEGAQVKEIGGGSRGNVSLRRVATEGD